MNTSRIKKFALETYGCQMNVADSELVEGILTNLGLEKTSDYDEADAIFLNTCAIRENAETKVHSKLGNLQKIKLNKPHLIIGVLGCMAQTLKDDLLKNRKGAFFVNEGTKNEVLLLAVSPLFLEIDVFSQFGPSCQIPRT